MKPMRDKRNSFEPAGALARKTYLGCNSSDSKAIFHDKDIEEIRCGPSVGICPSIPLVSFGDAITPPLLLLFLLLMLILSVLLLLLLLVLLFVYGQFISTSKGIPLARSSQRPGSEWRSETKNQILELFEPSPK